MSFIAGLAFKAVTRFPFLASAQFKLIAIIVLTLAVFAGGWTVRGWRESAAKVAAVEQARKQERAAYAKRDREHAAQAKRDEELLSATALERDLLLEQAERLRAATRSLPLTRTVTKVIHENCSCPDARLAPAVRVCHNAAVTGDSSAIAACEAERVPDRM